MIGGLDRSVVEQVAIDDVAHRRRVDIPTVVTSSGDSTATYYVADAWDQPR